MLLFVSIVLEAANFGALGAGIGAGLIAIGVGIGIGNIGAKSAEAVARQPEVGGDIRTNALILSAFIEGVALFGAVICFLALSA